MWYVYCVRCRGGAVYTGVTTDPKRRLREHNQGKGGAYTLAHRPVRLIYQEPTPDKSSALRREHEIKCLPRADKERLCKGQQEGTFYRRSDRIGRRRKSR